MCFQCSNFMLVKLMHKACIVAGVLKLCNCRHVCQCSHYANWSANGVLMSLVNNHRMPFDFLHILIGRRHFAPHLSYFVMVSLCLCCISNDCILSLHKVDSLCVPKTRWLHIVRDTRNTLSKMLFFVCPKSPISSKISSTFLVFVQI